MDLSYVMSSMIRCFNIIPNQILYGVLSVIFMGCIFESSSKDKAANNSKQLHYLVKLSQSPQALCEIQITLDIWPIQESILFQMPTYYADNPKLPVNAFKASQIQGWDSQNQSVVGHDTLLGSDTLSNHFVIFPKGTVKLKYFVDYDTNNTEQFGLPLPRLAAKTELIDGAYFFLLPYQGSNYASHWRNPLNIHLDFQMQAGMSFVGHPMSSDLVNNYELMFIKAVANPSQQSSFTHNGRDVITYSTGIDTVDLQALNTALKPCLKLVEDSLGTLPIGTYYVGTSPVFSGIEGDQGYWVMPYAIKDASVHTHELTHNFVGVHEGDLEDPWWKEGLTSYVGLLLALQGGLIVDSVFQKGLIGELDSFPAVHNLSLRSPLLRNHLFPALDTAYAYPDEKEGYNYLVYVKGGQAAMILDRYILEKSKGKYSIYTLIRDLYRNYHPAFSQQNFQTLINQYAGTSSEAFVNDLLNNRGAFSLDSLNNTFAALHRLHRFEPGLKALAKQASVGRDLKVTSFIHPIRGKY